MSFPASKRWHSFWLSVKFSFARLLRLDLVHCQNRYFAELSRLLPQNCRWLDVGCGKQIVPSWAIPLAEQGILVKRSRMFLGADVDDSLTAHPLLTHRLFASASRLPFDSGQFDFVTANMVVEHLDRPETFFAEAARVLAPGGSLLIHTPNFRYYLVFLAWLCPEFIKKTVVALLEGRREEDIFFTYYRANTAARARTLAATAGLSVHSVSVNGSVGSFGFLGPIGVLEVVLLKLLSLKPFRSCGQVLLVVMKKP